MPQSQCRTRKKIDTIKRPHVHIPTSCFALQMQFRPHITKSKRLALKGSVCIPSHTSRKCMQRAPMVDRGWMIQKSNLQVPPRSDPKLAAILSGHLSPIMRQGTTLSQLHYSEGQTTADIRTIFRSRITIKTVTLETQPSKSVKWSRWTGTTPLTRRMTSVGR